MKIVLNSETSAPQVANGSPQPECLINKAELARRVGRKVRTVDYWMAKGLIPYLKIGNAVLFKWSDVEGHLQQNFRVCRRNLPKS
jgi:excisionase family DNA binding protein